MGFAVSEAFSGKVPERWDVALFGEAPSRILVSVAPEATSSVLNAARGAGVPACVVGETGGSRLAMGPLIDVDLMELSDAWYGGLSPVWS